MSKTLFPFVIIILFQMNAFSQEIAVENYHDCWGIVFEIEEKGIKSALSYLSPTRNECRKGQAVLAIKKFSNHIQKQAEFEITDTLSIQNKCPENCLYVTRCEDNSGYMKQYILLINTQVLSDKFFNSFKKSWTYNDNLKIIDTTNKELTCVNVDYGA